MNKRKRHVADVALRLFVEKGIQQTSIQDIIEQAKISKGTFYNYFSTKNDCIAEILEGLRYDASQLRMEMQVGKDAKNREVFIDQISVLIQLNEDRNLHALFEAILNSNEMDLKKLVMHHRIYELDWLGERFVEVYGEDLRPYSFELSILFYGMLHYMLFTTRITNTTRSLHHMVDVLLSYTELIMQKMITQRTSLLDDSVLHFLRSKIDRKVMSVEEILEMAKNIEEEATFTIEQRDLYDTIVSELQQERIRKSVLQPLINPFRQAFVHSSVEAQVNVFTNSVWYFLRMN
ncbi:TetR/AcrR family transcriptional regulator [Fredinandcohnia humi]